MPQRNKEFKYQDQVSLPSEQEKIRDNDENIEFRKYTFFSPQ